MRKLIDIKDELIVPLKILAAKENKPFKIYLEDIIETNVKQNKPH